MFKIHDSLLHDNKQRFAYTDFNYVGDSYKMEN